MQDWLIAPATGTLLLTAGLFLMKAHRRTWQEQKQRTEDDEDRRHYHARYRRRMQTSGMIALIGVLVAFGDAGLPPLLNAFNLNPRRVAVMVSGFWIVVLVLTLWVLMLGFGDLFSTKAHSQAALARIRRKQRELEKRVEQLKSRGSNGHPDSMES